MAVAALSPSVFVGDYVYEPGALAGSTVSVTSGEAKANSGDSDKKADPPLDENGNQDFKLKRVTVSYRWVQNPDFYQAPPEHSISQNATAILDLKATSVGPDVSSTAEASALVSNSEQPYSANGGNLQGTFGIRPSLVVEHKVGAATNEVIIVVGARAKAVVDARLAPIGSSGTSSSDVTVNTTGLIFDFITAGNGFEPLEPGPRPRGGP